jgi:glyoxylase-like metal-dependent hydrolase (beta-lactamase superfamily II)
MSNTYVINETRLIVVDPCSALNVRLLSVYLRTFLHRSPADIDLIVLTNMHQDSTSGIESLRRICTAPIAASSAALTLTQSELQKTLPRLMYTLPGNTASFPPLSIQQAKYVDIWLQDVGGLPLHPDWRVIASAGHTPETICLYNPFTRELLSGDTIVTIENGTPLLRRGIHRDQLNETLRVLRSLPIRYLYPGHGRQIIGETPLGHVQIEW